MNASKLIMTLTAEECDESFLITVDLLELIIGYIGCCQLSHYAA